ncbi:MAG: NADH-quinone oxidoreductase subunit N, partial [Thaumarchaeota archaeon]|nr:NADH-quinone oxidoreductase subunit N [Nitrososphaerota archaeon]
VFSVLTMFFGNLAALLQDDAQRMMAYSSIAHAGYFFVGFAGISALAGLDPKWAMMGLLIHYAAYSLAKVGIFAGLEEVKEKVGGVMLSDLSGLGRRMPITSSMLLILLLSLMGAPPLLGFWGKLYLFASVVGLSPLLALLAILNSAISVAYYARVIKAMYFSPGDYERIPERGWPLYSIIASAILTVLLGLVASPLAEMVVP